MTAAWYWWRATWRTAGRPALAVVVVIGILGAVALAALAGARRTESAYGRYLSSIRASDVMVNIPTPDTTLIARVEHLRGVRSSAAWAGLAANPIVHGRVDDSFLTDSIESSVDGAFYRQDTLTVLAGRLPNATSTHEIDLSPGIAKLFGVGVGGTVRYQLYDGASSTTKVIGSASFRVAGIVEAPPALVDQFDEEEGAFLSPAATTRFEREISYSWVGLQLEKGTDGLESLQRSLGGLSTQIGPNAEFAVRRLDTVHRQVQEAIRPQAAALAIFGGLTSLALLVLVAQLLSRWLDRLANELNTLRALGLARRGLALTAVVGPALALMVGTVVAIGGALALSPLAPLAPVRQFDPVRGIQLDPTELIGGGIILLLALAGLLAAMAWRSVRPRGDEGPRPSSVVANAADAANVPRVVALGLRFALEPPAGRRKSVVRANLFGTVVAVLVVVTAVVFGASLDGLLSHPTRYGWNWNVLIQSQGGYGHFVDSPDPASFHDGDGSLDRIIASEHGVAGWSTFAFTQLSINDHTVPVIGVTTHRGTVEPPTVSGTPVDTSHPFRFGAPSKDVLRGIELGATTLRQLGAHVGDTVHVGTGRRTFALKVTGIVTLPSIGVGLSDHVSLGTGAMLAGDTLLSIEGLESLDNVSEAAISALPSTVAIDLTQGTRPSSVVSPILRADPGGTPGGDYQQPRVLGAPIVDANQMSGQPLVLALALGIAVLVFLSAAVVSSARRRRRELAVLLALGMTHRQLRSIIAWQTSTLLVVAVALGTPLGIIAGKWTWENFATSLGVVPTSVVPVELLIVGAVVLVGVGALLMLLPRFFSRASTPASWLRREE